MTKHLWLFLPAALVCLVACSSGGTAVQSALPTNASPSEHHRAKSPNPDTYTQELVVANGGVTTDSAGSILVFGLTVAPSPTPLQYIHGADTGLGDVRQVSVGPSGAIFAASYDDLESWVLKFSASANNDASPIAKIKVHSYDLEAVVVDAAGDIIAGGWEPPGSGGGRVFYFPSSANGYATPTKIIGPSGLNQPFNVAVDNSGNLYVPEQQYGPSLPAYINIFSSTASGNYPPAAKIKGSNTDLHDPTQVWIDNSTYGAGRIIVSDLNGNVLVFSPGATGNATPVQDITSVSNPSGVATDSTGEIYVSAQNTNEIRIFAKDATGSATPVGKIVGSQTKLNAPGQLFIAPYSGS
jgi:hypothetical protein